MANPQAPLLFKFTDDQQSILKAMHRDIVNNLLYIKFNEPENDQLRLRQHADLHGQLSAVIGILGYDKVALANYEQLVRDQEERVRNPQPSLSDE